VPAADASSKRVVYTIGHSTRAAGELVALLLDFDVAVLADTRSFPRSRRNPQFNPETLEPFLASHGVEYEHHPLLGGRRAVRKDSPNTAWQNAAFRGYADYMQTEAFERGIRELEDEARRRTVAVMCAELAWWRCHRRMIADRLTLDGFEVLHILTPRRPPYPHKLSPGLSVIDRRITYPAQQAMLPLG
jgi:uncharacterized protein (DUF488 family)